MSYWQNGKLFLYGSTQSVIRTVENIARWVGIEQSQIVLISEYCGGGFGSKGTGAVSMAIPALLSKKVGAPVMMRISREEEQVHRPRANRDGRPRQGGLPQGWPHHGDRPVHRAGQRRVRTMGDSRTGANAASLIWQPEAMRWRSVNVLTNTPPRQQQRSPGPAQLNAIMDPVVTKAAKLLGLDQVAIRRTNAPEGKAPFGPPGVGGVRSG